MEIQSSLVKLRSIIELIRPINCFSASIATLIGGIIGGFQPSVIIAAIVTFLGTGAGNSINDYFDAPIDAINNPNRPIPSGILSRKEALFLSILLFLVSVILTFLLPLLSILIGLINLFLLVFYSSHLKGIPLLGNITVGYLTGSAFLFGGVSVGGGKKTLILFLLASFVTLSREIIKDIEDIEGDRKKGARTLPQVWGKENSIYLSSIFAVIGIILSPLPFFIGFNFLYLIFIFLADITAIISIFYAFYSSSKAQKFLKISMLIAIFGFLIGSVSL